MTGIFDRQVSQGDLLFYALITILSLTDRPVTAVVAGAEVAVLCIAQIIRAYQQELKETRQ